MSEIEVGDYVRLNIGKIGKVILIEKGSIMLDIESNRWVGLCCIKSHSKNIIDLIEKGDIVNGHTAVEFNYGDDDFEIYWTLEAPYNIRTYCVGNEDIKSILTHEFYEQNCYKVVI